MLARDEKKPGTAGFFMGTRQNHSDCALTFTSAYFAASALGVSVARLAAAAKSPA